MGSKIQDRQCACSGFDSFIKNGFDAQGKQRWKCKYCGRADYQYTMKKLTTDVVYRTAYSDAELYCLGYLVADGWVQKNRLGICLHQDDLSIIELIKHTFNLDNKITMITRKDGRQHAQMLFRIAYFEEDYLHLGLSPRKTGKEVWLSYMENPHFVRGFFDGDGSIYIQRSNKRRMSFVTANRSFLEGLNTYVCKELGIPNRTIYDNTGSSGNYMIRFNSRYADQLGDWLYKDSKRLRLERKYKKYLEI